MKLRYFYYPTFLLFFIAALQGQETAYEAHNKVELNNAERAQVNVSIFAGQLNLSGKKQAPLLIGEYFYDDPEYGEPVKSYEVIDGVGYLKIENREFHDIDIDDDEECTWNMHMNNQIPMDLSINMAAGEGNIMLEGARINRLDYALKAGVANINLRNTSVPRISFKAIAGEATLDISGIWKNDLEASLKGGVGDMTIILPKDYNLEIDIDGLIGEINVGSLRKENGYYVRRTSNREPTLRIDITGGIGQINLKVAD